MLCDRFDLQHVNVAGISLARLLFTAFVQLVAARKIATPLRELRRLVRMRLVEDRDTVGFNLAALRAIAKVVQEKKSSYFNPDENEPNDIWAGLGLGSDVAAALEQKGGRNNRRPS